MTNDQEDGGLLHRREVPTPAEQAIEAARDDPSRTELTNMVYDLPGVTELLVDGEDEGWRPTVITVGFGQDGYRYTGDVIDVMQAAGWNVGNVVFGPYNRISFQESANE